jgi:hypothetical protein
MVRGALKVIFVVAVTAAAAAFATDSKRPAPKTTTPTDPQKSQGSMTKTPKEECEELMNALLPMVKKLLSEHGEFFPVGGTMQTDGSIAFVATYDGDEHPPSQKVIDSLMDVYRAGAKQKKYKATALIYDIRTVPPGATEKTDAVAARLDHLSGYSVLVVFPYHLSPNREVVFAQPFANKGPADIFSKP